ncbi:hypothetical protein M8818_003314 [Zalaria obscura]|uniref:Uncharacterized protein n=1 Tax=Zalaria obscura TaxID=2024903 RepID=A0ACC3SFD4_9PEZI
MPGVLDVVITAGKGKKYLPTAGHNTAPTCLFDDSYSCSTSSAVPLAAAALRAESRPCTTNKEITGTNKNVPDKEVAKPILVMNNRTCDDSVGDAAQPSQRQLVPYSSSPLPSYMSSDNRPSTILAANQLPNEHTARSQAPKRLETNTDINNTALLARGTAFASRSNQDAHDTFFAELDRYATSDQLENRAALGQYAARAKALAQHVGVSSKGPLMRRIDPNVMASEPTTPPRQVSSSRPSLSPLTPFRTPAAAMRGYGVTLPVKPQGPHFDPKSNEPVPSDFLSAPKPPTIRLTKTAKSVPAIGERLVDLTGPKLDLSNGPPSVPRRPNLNVAFKTHQLAGTRALRPDELAPPLAPPVGTSGKAPVQPPPPRVPIFKANFVAPDFNNLSRPTSFRGGLHSSDQEDQDQSPSPTPQPTGLSDPTSPEKVTSTASDTQPRKRRKRNTATAPRPSTSTKQAFNVSMNDLYDWQTPALSKNSIVTFADAEICNGLRSVGREEGGMEGNGGSQLIPGMLRPVKKERPGEFREESVLMGVRFVVV